MAVVLLFDGVVDDYGGDRIAVTVCYHRRSGKSLSASLMYFTIIYDGNRST